MTNWIVAAVTAGILLISCGSESASTGAPTPTRPDPSQRIVFYLAPGSAPSDDPVQATSTAVARAMDAGDPALTPPININNDRENTAVALDVVANANIESYARTLRDRFFAAAGVLCVIVTEIPPGHRAGDGSLGSLAERQAQGASCLS